ncbi:MAG: DUF4870 domain-containing protein [Dethiobacteria bacterium]|jgi:uncharacterized membrane protein|nr:DUF4870 domain-containing protein [Bacillota bacterium]HOP69909.1 DUF4870 domain-containing protein [Bacillota bacterium]HPZ65210.1 DUF4870 domain-containing protein [Bacillota bacterium]
MDDGPLSTGLDPKTAGLLCYLLGFVTGLIFFFLEKENRFVRFHALQSILASVAIIVILFIIDSLFVALFSSLHLFFIVSLLKFVGTLLGLAALALWVVLMVKAYQGEYFKLPVVGDLAGKNS